MRWIALVLAFCFLAVAVVMAWDWRFCLDSAGPQIAVHDRGSNILSLSVLPGEPPCVRVFPIPYEEPVDALLLSFSHRATGLEPREEPWQSGRVLVDWVDERGKTLRTDTLLGLKGTDDGFRSSQTVVRFGLGKGWPVLRFEHLGRSGRMELRDLKIMPVKSHPLIRMIVVALLAGGGIWFVSWLRLLSVAAWWRCLLGGGGLLAMIWLLVVPGPWAHPRPFGNCFRTGGSAADVEVVEFPNADNKKANSPEPLGKMPIQGSWLVKVKIVLSLLRPVLHVLLFAIPAAGLAFLCGVRCAALSMVAMTILVELSQAWFWFGFDWVDGFDLLTDWGGIGVALWGYQRVLRSIPTHGPVGMLKRMAFPLPQPS